MVPERVPGVPVPVEDVDMLYSYLVIDVLPEVVVADKIFRVPGEEESLVTVGATGVPGPSKFVNDTAPVDADA